MGNYHFDFKAFRVRQENAAMKVCTDSCLFGAWAASLLSENRKTPLKLLDIGTGTGLLSLMVTQRIFAEVHAVEIDDNSIKDATINFDRSPWKQRLFLHHGSIQEFSKQHLSQFDAVICNPPFFVSSLRSPHKGKNLSKHEENLSIGTLVECLKIVLKEDGLGFVLLPAGRGETFENLLKAENMHIVNELVVKQTSAHTPFRYFYCISNAPQEAPVRNEMSIKTNDKGYTKEFSALLKQYYLAL